jgi:hypothetical protein
MRPEIEAYLRQHRARYTTKALREQLTSAGYDAAEVDTALQEWDRRGTDPASAVIVQRRFWRWAIGLHAAVLVLIAIASLVIGSFATASSGPLVVLAVALLIGLGISGLVGRGVVQGSGLTAALALPGISALLIGGSCLALGGSYLLRAPPRTGVMELRIDPPLSFNGSGVAYCDSTYGLTTGFAVWAHDLGNLNGSLVGVSLNSSTPQVVSGPEAAGLSITLYPAGEEPPASWSPVSYSPIFSTRIELDASADGRSGTLRFEGLEPAFLDKPPGEVPGFDPISGIVTWACE